MFDIANIEKYLLTIVVVGIVLLLAGWLWLLVRAFKQRVAWGLGILFFPPLALIFAVKHGQVSRAPIFLMLFGALVAAGTVTGNQVYNQFFLSLGPYEKMVEYQGQMERHLTLTKWDRNDYSILRHKRDTIVLQMANPDVTDQTLEFLRGMNQLRELDVNYSQVTDTGLTVLKELPNLAILRLRKTKVTDEGLKELLAARQTLKELDLQETEVKTKTLRDWKNEDKDNRKFMR